MAVWVLHTAIACSDGSDAAERAPTSDAQRDAANGQAIRDVLAENARLLDVASDAANAIIDAGADTTDVATLAAPDAATGPPTQTDASDKAPGCDCDAGSSRGLDCDVYDCTPLTGGVFTPSCSVRPLPAGGPTVVRCSFVHIRCGFVEMTSITDGPYDTSRSTRWYDAMTGQLVGLSGSSVSLLQVPYTRVHSDSYGSYACAGRLPDSDCPVEAGCSGAAGLIGPAPTEPCDLSEYLRFVTRADAAPDVDARAEATTDAATDAMAAVPPDASADG